MCEEEVASIRLSIKESLQNLDNYKAYLSSELVNVNSTREGVKCSIAKAKKEVEDKFESIEQQLLKALALRKKDILLAINDVANKDLEPLNNLEEKINGELETVEKLKIQGNDILEEEDSVISEKAEQTLKEINIQQNRYPNMPCISQTLSVTFEENHIECVNHIGEISMTGSLQIVTLAEQPGGMLVEWDDTFSDSESVTEYSGVQEYILQCCCTDNKGNHDGAVFNTVYNGEGMSHVVTDLEPHVSYTFRVCGRFGRDGRWSSWSIPRSGMTTLDPHEWSAEDCLNMNQLAIYQLSNKRRTATKVFPDSSKVLRSKTMSYRVETALQFKIDETGDDSNGDGIGLTTSSFDFSNSKQNLQCPGSVSINSKGLVYVNGNSMTTQMPAFKRGTVIIFEVNQLNPGKLRVSISVDDKQVTFDWAIEEKDDCTKLYFAMGFQHSGWQITV
ncbi:cytokine receptor-like factor 3 [Exaiptasia diaphana]|uniref:Fibronectin type-III domain-containing protein n=1 Tax=Exaiptasia diaphana TaxID=2652724 RepID=A0A913X8C0_EXADI|nr:cytokine receptor-like factor 3 [Exaiptasia diaphana]KXJ28571.1 Cytokine receptor-like factor 3 [Exaiptasia diaphana]